MSGSLLPMTKLIISFNANDIVIGPFPFTDRAINKRRPALVLSTKSFNDAHKHIILAMITSAKNPSWSSDIVITDLASAGLPSASVIRFKIFTIDERLVLSTLGKLSNSDKIAVKKGITNILS
jgi:mRNA interferase MazF